MNQDKYIFAARDACQVLEEHCVLLNMSDGEKSGVRLLTLSLMLYVLAKQCGHDEDERAFCETATVCRSFLTEKAWNLLSK